MLFFARTAMGFQFQSVAAVSPLLVADLGIDFALLGVLIGAWMLPGVAVAIPGGMLGRLLGDKPVVLAGLALMAAGSLLVAAADTYAAAMAGRVVSGAGAVILNVLLAKMVADWFHDRGITTAMALLVISWPLGIGLALAVLGPLAALRSWAAAVQVTAWVCVAALALVALVYRRPAHARAEDAGVSWRLSRREFALACIAGLIWTFYNVGYIIAVSFAPVLLAARGVDIANAAVVSSFATWPLMVSVALGGVLADRSGRGHEIMLGALLAMALTLPFLLAAPSALAMLAIFGLIAGLPGGIIAALPARALPPQARHMGLGIFFTLYYLGMALLPGLAGWFRDFSRIDSAPLAFGGALLLLGAGCALLFRRVETWRSA